MCKQLIPGLPSPRGWPGVEAMARPSLLCAGDAMHPVLQKGVVWFTRLGTYIAIYTCMQKLLQ